MEKITTIIALFFIAIFLTGNSAQAQQITKPFTFQAGQPAKANEVNGNFDVLYSKVNQMDKPIIWSGGCSNDGGSNGSFIYCTDGTDFNTAQVYFEISKDGTFTVLVSGFYRINAFTRFLQIGATSSGDNRSVELVVNGNSVESHSVNYPGTWGDLRIRLLI
jgi:hypothetical protein